MGTLLRIAQIREHPELLDISIADINDEQITSWVRGGDGVIGFEFINLTLLRGQTVLSKLARGGDPR